MVKAYLEVLCIRAILRINLWIWTESLSPPKCGEKRNGIRKGTGGPGSHRSASHFFKRRFHSLSCYFSAAQITSLFATQTSLILRFRASPDGLRGLGGNLSHATRELFGVGFFHFALTHWRLPQPETRHGARHTDARGGREGWKVPGCGVLLMVEPMSDIRSAQEQTSLSRWNQRELLLVGWWSSWRKLGWFSPPL